MVYICEEEEMKRLREIQHRLYSPEILDYNARRDLAHRLELAIDNIAVNIDPEYN